MTTVRKYSIITAFALVASTISSPAYDNWIERAHMPYMKLMHTCGFSLNGHFFMINGTAITGGQQNFNFEYNPDVDTWTQRAAPPTNISKLHAFSIGNYGYAGIGGYGGSTTAWYQYDYVTNSWTTKSPFPGVCRYDGAAFSIGDYGYIVGGQGTYNYEVWAYHASTDTWIQKNNLSQSRKDAGWFVISQKAYVVAGIVNNAVSNSCIEYNPITDTWTNKASIPIGVYFAGISFNIGNKGYFGFGDSGWNRFWEYDPAIDTWTSRNNNNAPAGFYWHCNSSFCTANRGFSGGPGPGSGWTPAPNWFEYIPPNFVLPVELIKFDSKLEDSDVKVSWTTASETNNSHFVLEHSLNGLDFKEISRMDGSGTINTSVNYQYIHINPENGMHYYRLLQYDFDGQYTVSKIVFCRKKPQNNQLNLWHSYPDNVISIDNLDSDTKYKLCFYSSSGILVYLKSFEGTGQFSFLLSEAFLSNGIYFYSLQSDARVVQSGRLFVNQ